MLDRVIFGRIRVQRDLPIGPFGAQFAIQEMGLARPDGVQLRGWRSRPLALSGAPIEQARARRVLLYFGGRNEDVIWAPKMASYLGGWTIYAFNHRGMGASGGRPSERLVHTDSLALWHWVQQQEGKGVQEWAIAGRSLGSAIAVQLAAQVQPDQLILFSPFHSLRRLLVQHWWSWPLLAWGWRKFCAVHHAPKVTARTLVLLAQTDTRVPRSESMRLLAALPRAPLVVEIPGTTHQSLPRKVATQHQLAAFLGGERDA